MWDLSPSSQDDKSWLNGKVRSVNLQLDWALMGRGMSHINVTDTGTIVREEYITHGSHLNSSGKMRLLLPMLEPLLF